MQVHEYLYLSIFHFYHVARVKLQTPFYPLIFNQLIIIKLVQNYQKYWRGNDPKYWKGQIFSNFWPYIYDQNYLKVCKFCRYVYSPSFFNCFLLIYQISTVQCIKCRNKKDDINCSYNCWGDTYPLKVLLYISTIQYTSSRLARLTCRKTVFYAIFRHF